MEVNSCVGDEFKSGGRECALEGSDDEGAVLRENGCESKQLVEDAAQRLSVAAVDERFGRNWVRYRDQNCTKGRCR